MKIIEEATRRRGDYQKARDAIKKDQVDIAPKKSQTEYKKEVAGRAFVSISTASFSQAASLLKAKGSLPFEEKLKPVAGHSCGLS
jgi:hypothetical protein